jgi:hypothetical protein
LRHDRQLKAYQRWLSLLAISMAMYILMGYQAVHENPDFLILSHVQSVDDQVYSLINGMAMCVDSISSYIPEKDYTRARKELSLLGFYSDSLQTFVGQINISDQDYSELAMELGSIRADISELLDHAERYNRSLELYNASLASGDSMDASRHAAELQASYEGIGTVYNRLYANATSAGQLLDGMGVDTDQYKSAIESLNQQINRLVDTYGEVVPGERSPSLLLSAYTGGEPGVVRFKAALSDGNRSPVSNARVDIFVNGSPAGTMTTGPGGDGSLDYAGPGGQAASAVYVPAGNSKPAVYSNRISLPVQVQAADLSLYIDRDEARSGDVVNVSGAVKAPNGAVLSGMAVDILVNGGLAGSTVTRDGGSYTYYLGITPYFPAGPCTIQAAYQGKNGTSLSRSLLINISAMSAALTVGALSSGADNISVNGRLIASNGAPVEGAKISIYLDDALAGRAITNSGGTYGASIAIPKNALPGDHTVRSSFEPGEGKALLGASSDILNISVSGVNTAGGRAGWYLAAFAGAGILLAAAFILILLLATRLPRRKPISPPILTYDARPDMPEPVTPAPLIAPVPDDEFARVLGEVKESRTREAQRIIYLSTINVAAYCGVDIRDCMTHREFQAAASRTLPGISGQLSLIIGYYERAAYAPFDVPEADVYLALDSLKEIFTTLKIDQKVAS